MLGRLFARIALPLLIVFALPAAAQADVLIGDLSGTSYGTVTSYGNGVTFSDNYIFDLSAPSSYEGILSSIQLSNFYSVDNLMLTLTGPGGYYATYTPVFFPSAQVIDTGTLLLPAGTGYTANIAGTVTGTLGGYTLLMTAVPVPEPAEWALLSLGLAALSGVTRRLRGRNQSRAG